MRFLFSILLLSMTAGCAFLSPGIYSVSFPQAAVSGISAGHYAKVTVDQKPGPFSSVRIRLGIRNAGSAILKTNPYSDRLVLRSTAGTEFPVDLAAVPDDAYDPRSVPPGAYIAYDLEVRDKNLAAMILRRELKEIQWNIGERGVIVMQAYDPANYAVV